MFQKLLTEIIYRDLKFLCVLPYLNRQIAIWKIITLNRKNLFVYILFVSMRYKEYQKWPRTPQTVALIFYTIAPSRRSTRLMWGRKSAFWYWAKISVIFCYWHTISIYFNGRFWIPLFIDDNAHGIRISMSCILLIDFCNSRVKFFVTKLHYMDEIKITWAIY